MGSQSSNQLRQQDMKSHKLIQNNGYGLGQVVSFFPQPQQQYVLKTQLVASKKQYEKYNLINKSFLAQLQQYKSLDTNLFVELIGTRYQKGGFCSSSDTVQGLFQYIKLNLKQELDIRIQNSNPMKQKSILSLIHQLIKCCLNIQQKNRNLGYLDPSMILIKKQNQYKLCLIGTLFENEIALNKDYSPPEQQNINYQKYRIFMIGLIAIQCITLHSIKQIRQFSFENFKRTMYKLTCTKGLKDLLMLMVSTNSLKRPTYQQCLQEIARLEKLKMNSKLNHSIKKDPQYLFSTASGKKNSQKKSPSDSETILFRRSQRERNLLSQLYSPKRT